ncbi:DNA primase [Thalassoglobus sp. JC818]|uniref:DNA primase n=1 Tax=Thalassoglobus sp. JC818 TaxID=3232136 RepID=UPI003459EE93
MLPLSPQEFREQVRSHTDIVGLIGESVGLESRSGGREHVGLCPFHDDHNPSMRVYPERQTFRCWSCNTGGDCFTFVMEREKVTFPEALEILARRANLEIPRFVSGHSPQQETNRARLFEVLQWAEQQFHQTLMESPAAQPAREYLKQRGMTGQMVRQFRLGFHPDNWEWLIDRAKGKFPLNLLLEARLIGERDNRQFDFFVNRVMFPIHNERGQAVSFGGRVLPGSNSDAKYWNGPESSVFHKSRLLFAIDHAREAIRESNEAFIVEGYTDCIACHQFGIANVVGTLGTALTDEHVSAIKRFARKVILVFDGDQAGQDAAIRAVEKFLLQDVDLRILTLPEQMDPADFLEREGTQAFREIAESAPEAWDYRFRAAKAKFGLNSIDARQRVLDEMLSVLACVPQMATSVREPLLIANLAQRLQVPDEVIRRQLAEVRTNSPRKIRLENSNENRISEDVDVRRLLAGELSKSDRVECDLLEVIFTAPQLLTNVINTIKTSQLRNPILRRVLEMCFEEVQSTSEHQESGSGQLTLSGLLNRMPNQQMKSLIVWLDEQANAKGLAAKLEGNSTESGIPQVLHDSIGAILDRDAEQTHQNLAVQLTESKDGRNGLDEATEQLLRQAAEFHQKRATRKAGV